MGLFNKRIHPTRKKISEWAEEIGLVAVEEDGSFMGMQGSALMKVLISETSDDSGLALLTCHMLQDVPNKPGTLEELFFGVGQEKALLLFWDANKSDDGSLNIFLELCLIDHEGSLDRGEFESALYVLAETADALDDKLQKKIGGRRAEDVMNS